MDAQVQPPEAAPFHGQHLRAEALHDALSEFPLQERLLRRKVQEDLAAVRHLKIAAFPILQGNRRQGDAIEGIGKKLPRHAQDLVDGVELEILHRRGEAQQVARLHRPQRPGGRGETHLDEAFLGIAGDGLLAAVDDAGRTHRIFVIGAAEMGDVEGLGGGERDVLERRILVLFQRQAQGNHGAGI